MRSGTRTNGRRSVVGSIHDGPFVRIVQQRAFGQRNIGRDSRHNDSGRKQKEFTICGTKATDAPGNFPSNQT